MPAPVYVAGTPGNLMSAALGPGQSAGALLDLTTVIEGQLNCEVVTVGALAVGVTFGLCRAYGAGPPAPPIALAAAAAAGATSLSVGSAAGLRAGQVVGLWHPGTPGVGEPVTISAIAGAGPYTLSIAGTAAGGTIHGYAAGDGLYPVDQSAGIQATPRGPAGGWPGNGDFGCSVTIPTGLWYAIVSNPDPTHTPTAIITVDLVTGYF